MVCGYGLHRDYAGYRVSNYHHDGYPWGYHFGWRESLPAPTRKLSGFRRVMKRLSLLDECVVLHQGSKMIAGRNLVRFIFAALLAGSLLQVLPALAEEGFARFFPLFVDLDGWQGKKPEGLSIADGAMTTATREYQQGAAQLRAVIVLGPAAAAALAATRIGVNIETGDVNVITSTMDGFPVTRTYDVPQKSGGIIVALGQDAMFTIYYKGITEDEVLPLAKKFDWKALQAMADQK